MKKGWIKGIFISVAILSGFLMAVPMLAPQPVYAETVPCTCANGQSGTMPKTAILSESTICDCGNGEAIIGILKLVVNIMVVGIGILGVIGIIIVGIQYMTAGGNEEKTRKAKRRMLEIVIGLAVFAVLYAILNWLIPGFSGI
ncbi:hypothetical protein IJG04_03115 [Candidatus Saccharibacteria bacterium]|nr:hypothetical protein [Candidatus Saccharibacteria bacterium]